MSQEELTVQLATRLPKRLHTELKRLAIELDSSLMVLVQEAIELRLKAGKGKSSESAATTRKKRVKRTKEKANG